MEAGVTQAAKSILEKPLGQLTEEDISQLTREDCRRFLKEKGMRRPSWNKSQAIQQVLSLKALFEPGDDSGAAVLRKILASPPENVPGVKSTSIESVEELEGGAQIPSPLNEIGACTRKDPPRSAESGGQFVAVKEDNKLMSPRIPGEINVSVGQMTIFYCGKVNVYDGVPPEKALAIMHFAANPIDLPQNDSSRLQTETGKCNFVHHSGMLSKTMHTEKMVEFPQYYQEIVNVTRDSDVEGQANRKVSLQRYLEKRKDRARFFKGKKGSGAASSSLEMYLNQQQLNTSYGQSSRSSTASPPNFDSTADNQTKNAHLSVALNREDI